METKDLSSAILIVSAAVIPGKEDEFNKWYDEHHIPLYSSKMPLVKSIKRFYSRRSNPAFLAIYEYASMDDLKRSLASREAKGTGEDADKQIGVTARSFTFNSYSQIYPV
ncbi:MAG: hypothetical protein ACYC7D_13020 [Nitrososphaerales archaeon]